MAATGARRVWFAFFTVIAAWGTSYLFIRLAISSFTPFGLVSTRFGVAAVLCAVVARVRGERLPPLGQASRFAAVGMLMMSGSNGLTAFAQKTVASGITGVVHALGSVWLAALGALGLWGPRTPGRAWWGVAGGVLGVGLLLWPEPGHARADPLGVLALLCATLVFAFASLLQRRAQAEGATGLFAQLSVQMFAGSATSAALAVLTGVGFVHGPLTPTSLGAVGFLTFVSSIAGFAGYAVVLREWPAARAGSFAVLNPLVSVLLGVLVLDEPLTVRMVLGMAVTLLSVGWVQRAVR